MINVRINIVVAPISDFFSLIGVKYRLAYFSPMIAAMASGIIIIRFVIMNKGLFSPQNRIAKMNTERA